jgi:hypothetical protein
MPCLSSHFLFAKLAVAFQLANAIETPGNLLKRRAHFLGGNRAV